MKKSISLCMVLILLLSVVGVTTPGNRVLAAEVASLEINLDTTVENTHGHSDGETIAMHSISTYDCFIYSFLTKPDNTYYSITYNSEANDEFWGVFTEQQLAGRSYDGGILWYGGGKIGSFNLGNLSPSTKYYVLIPKIENSTKKYYFRINSFPDDVGDDYNSPCIVEPDKLYTYKLNTSKDKDCFVFDTGNYDYSLSVDSDSSMYNVYKDDLLTQSVYEGIGTRTVDLKGILSQNTTYWIKFTSVIETVDEVEYSFRFNTLNKKPDPSEDPVVTIEVPDVENVSVSPENRKVTLKWKKTKGASGYQIVRSMKKKKGYKTIKTIKKGSTVFYIDKKVKSGKTYFYKIRAYKKSGKKTIYGGWSPVKKVKVQ